MTREATEDVDVDIQRRRIDGLVLRQGPGEGGGGWYCERTMENEEGRLIVVIAYRGLQVRPYCVQTMICCLFKHTATYEVGGCRVLLFVSPLAPLILSLSLSLPPPPPLSLPPFPPSLSLLCCPAWRNVKLCVLVWPSWSTDSSSVLAVFNISSQSRCMATAHPWHRET